MTIGLSLFWLLGKTTWALVSNTNSAPEATVSLIAENVSFPDDLLRIGAGEVTRIGQP